MKNFILGIFLSVSILGYTYAQSDRIVIVIESDRENKALNSEILAMSDLDELRFTGKYEKFDFTRQDAGLYSCTILTNGPKIISKFSKLPISVKLSCLLMPGDSIRITSVKGNVRFSGKGAEVFACLQEISTMWSKNNQDSLVEHSLEKPASEEAFWSFTRTFGDNFLMFNTILNKYKNKLSPISFAFFKADLMAGFQSSLGVLIGHLSYYRRELGISGERINGIYDEVIMRYRNIICNPVDTLGITTSVYGMAPFARVGYLRSKGFEEEDWLGSWIGTYYYCKANFSGLMLGKLLTEIVNLYLIRESPGDNIAYQPIKDFMSLPGYEYYKKKTNDLFFSRFKVAFSDIGSDGKFINKKLYKDGPYIFREEGYIIKKNIDVVDSRLIVQTDTITSNTPIPVSVVIDGTQRFFNVKVKNDLQTEAPEYPKPSNLIAISDIEGNFDAFINLLQANRVVDKDLGWSFGSGHLVLIGDFVDRGTEVTEVLWLIYFLEEQAKRHNGYVHLLLGNHEIMNLANFTGYVHKKYLDNAKLLSKDYASGLYGKNSEIGRWLRTKNVMEKIGNVLFTHAGVSLQLNNLNESIRQINDLARLYYGGEMKKEYNNKKINTIMSSSVGPFWYRGYYGKYKNASMGQIDSTLKKFGVEKIVTGHTIIGRGEEVTSHFNGKVINTDTHHAGGRSEALLIEKDSFYRVDLQGKRMLLSSSGSKRSMEARETE